MACNASCRSSGPRKVHEGTAELEQRILHMADDAQKGILEIKVCLTSACLFEWQGICRLSNER